MAHSRRAVLRRVLVVGSVGLSGCVTDQTDPGPSTTEDPVPTEIQFWLEEVQLSESEKDAIAPIAYSDLSNKQKAIVQTALEDGEYTSVIGEESSALADLRRQISAQTNGGVEAYLKRGDTYFRIGYVSGDHIIADA